LKLLHPSQVILVERAEKLGGFRGKRGRLRRRRQHRSDNKAAAMRRGFVWFDATHDVHFWHLADMAMAPDDARFRRQSGHRLAGVDVCL
jgi:hypothetical protein